MSANEIRLAQAVSWRSYGKKRPCAAALGFFDGVHSGHVSLLKRTLYLAEAEGLEPVVFTFRNHPSEFLCPERKAGLLCTFEDKVRFISELGLSCVYADFDAGLASLSPEAFVKDILIDGLNVRIAVAGENYSFGHKAAGNVELLRRLGMRTEVMPCRRADGYSVSSSVLRRLISEGKLEEASEMWGRVFQTEGVIVHGRRVGRTLGIPTANIDVPAELISPPRGVYAAWCSLTPAAGQVFSCPEGMPGLAYWGSRPTFDNGRDLLEVFLMAPDGIAFGAEQLYGWQLRTALYKMIRPQIKFSGTEAFVAQVSKDRQAVLDYFQNLSLRR